MRDAIPRDRLQPANRSFDEGQWRHEVARHADEQRLEQPFDQTVVVVIRHPTGNDAVGGIARRRRQQPTLVEHVAVADHDSLRGRRRTGRVLQERNVVWSWLGFNERVRRQLGIHRQAIGTQPEQTRQLRVEVLMQRCEQFIGRQDQRCLRVGDDRLQTWQSTQHPRRVRRRQGHRDQAGLQTAKKGDQKIDALRVEQQRSRATLGGCVQTRRDDLRRAMQLAIGQSRSFLLAVDQELIRELIRRTLRAAAQ